jgi:PKD repeat protein
MMLPCSHFLRHPHSWYAHSFVENGGGCVSGAAYVPEGLWPSKYKFLFADFAFREIYNLIDDDNAGCRECSPPTSKFRNETFYNSMPLTGEDGRIVDIFFGSYNDSQALYVVHLNSKESVVRIKYTGKVNNHPPWPVITVEKRNFLVGEVVPFSAAQSTDPDGDILTFEWNFGDNQIGAGVNVSHVYADSGQYVVALSATDDTGQKQQTFESIVVGAPPLAVITSPKEGEEFYVGQVFKLLGNAYDSQGRQLDDSKLSWEVRQHHAEHYHPFLEPITGNNLTLYPTPAPEDIFASTNSYLRIILTATDNNGLSTQVDRIVNPTKVTIGLNSKPRGLLITVDSYPVKSFGQIVSWVGHTLIVRAEDQDPYIFLSWANGSTKRERRVRVKTTSGVQTANFCLKNRWQCSSNKDCCSGKCIAYSCVASV